MFPLASSSALLAKRRVKWQQHERRQHLPDLCQRPQQVGKTSRLGNMIQATSEQNKPAMASTQLKVGPCGLQLPGLQQSAALNRRGGLQHLEILMGTCVGPGRHCAGHPCRGALPVPLTPASC